MFSCSLQSPLDRIVSYSRQDTTGVVKILFLVIVVVVIVLAILVRVTAVAQLGLPSVPHDWQAHLLAREAETKDLDAQVCHNPRVPGCDSTMPYPKTNPILTIKD